MRDLLNQADEMMAKDAYVLPLFQKPTFIAVYSDFVNIRHQPDAARVSTYNIQDWAPQGSREVTSVDQRCTT